MAKQLAQGGENEHHVVSVRLRVTGEGDLLLSLTDLDDVQEYTMTPLPMTPTTRIEPTRLSNFQSQRIRVVGYTDVIDEYFRINKIIIFAKPVAVEYPG